MPEISYEEWQNTGGAGPTNDVAMGSENQSNENYWSRSPDMNTPGTAMWDTFTQTVDQFAADFSIDSGSGSQSSGFNQSGGLMGPSAELRSNKNNGQDSIASYLSNLYKTSTEQEKGFAWSALVGLANAPYKKAQADYYKTSAEVAQGKLELERQQYENKLKQQGSTAEALKNARRPGLINYTPLKVQSVDTRIA